MALYLALLLVLAPAAPNVPPLVDDPGEVREIRSLPADTVPTVVEPELVWSYENASGELLFGAISDAGIGPDGMLYLLDLSLDGCHVFSPEGDYLREIRAVGEGPGEYQRAYGLDFLPTGELVMRQIHPPQLAILSPDGLPLRTIVLRDADGQREGGIATSFKVVQEGFLVGHQTTRHLQGTSLLTRSFDRHDGEGRRSGTIVTHAVEQSSAGGIMMGSNSPFQGALVFDDGSLVLGLDYDDLRLGVYPVEGEGWTLRDPAWEAVPRPAKEHQDSVERVAESARRIGIPAPAVSAFEPAVGRMLVSPAGHLLLGVAGECVGCPEGALGPFREIDLEGSEHARYAVALAVDPEEDFLQLFPRHALVVRHGLDGLRAHHAQFNSGDDEDDADPTEPEPMRLEFYRLDFPGL